MKQIFYIQGLNCANCASKIEKQLLRLNGVNSVHLDLVSGTLHILTSGNNLDLETIQEIIDMIEPDVLVFNERHDVDENFLFPLSVIVGLVFYVLAFIMTYIFKGEIITLISRIHFIIAYLLMGGKVIKKAVLNIRQGKVFDENFLMTIATVGAILLGELAEAVAVMLFYRIGDYFQARALSKSRKSIKSLFDLKPTIAHLYEAETVKDVLPETLNIGMKIIVKNGEKIPVDGIVITGESNLDVRMLTGETMPLIVKEGDLVLSGAINNGTGLLVQVTETYAQSTVMKMIAFLQQNVNKKAKTEQFMTRFAKVYTPVVVIIGLMIAFLMPLFLMLLGQQTFISALLIYGRRALIFLVISCPCALVLSIPLSFFAGIGVASKRGVLIKSGLDLEMLNQIEHVVFDKTGTLTKGEFAIAEIHSDDEDELLKVAAHVEYASTHPIAKAIVDAYKNVINLEDINDVKERLGYGIEAFYKGKKSYVGKKAFLLENEIHIAQTTNSNQMMIHIAYDGKYLGYLVMSDQIRESAMSLIKDIQKRNIDVSMVTGDQVLPAQAVANALNIQNVYTNCLPFEKVDIIKTLKQNQKVAFVGDGMNDALVLSQAHLGIAMGGIGSDLALEASDLVIMNDDLKLIKVGMDISIKTKHIVMQNIYMSIGVKIVFLLLGALGIANIWMAVFADVGILIITVLNALRIFKI